MEAYFLNKAKSFYTYILWAVVLWAVGSAVPLSVLAEYTSIKQPYQEIMAFGPAVVGLLMAPVGMYFILKSFQKQEPNKKEKLVYLLGLLLINGLAMYIVMILATGNKPFID